MAEQEITIEKTNSRNLFMTLLPLINCFIKFYRVTTRVTNGTIPLLFAVLLVSPLGTAKAAMGSIVGMCKVVDGDTIFVMTGDTQIQVRLRGVAAPEDPREPGGKQATAFIKTLCEGQPVRCELDGSKTRGREVGFCYVDETDIGAAVIEAGLARECLRFSGGRYGGLEKAEAKLLAFPGYCSPR